MATRKDLNPSTLNTHGINVVLKNPRVDTTITLDESWAKSTFIITDKELSNGSNNAYEAWIIANRYSSSADHKFSSTSPGMSLGVNPKPQFTRYCDIRSKGRVEDRPDITASTQYSTSGLGMGGYYSTAIDDNQQRAFFRFGVPSYMPLPIWIARTFDVNKAVLQGRGTITSLFLEALNVTTKFFVMVTQPLMSLAMFAIKAFSTNARFYSVKPTMYIYWATVENTLNALVARRTMLPYILQDYTYKLNGTVGTPEAISEEFIETLNSYIPDIIHKETGRISVFAIALRSQATYNRIRMQELLDTKDKGISDAKIEDDIGVTKNQSVAKSTNPAGGLMDKLFKKAHEFTMGSPKDDTVAGVDDKSTVTSGVVGYHPAYTNPDDGAPLELTLDVNDPTDSIEKRLKTNVNAKASFFEKYGEYVLSELSEGAAFAVFNVESTGSVGESFSSSFGTNPIESTFNAFSAKARNLGSLLQSATSIPVVGDAIKLAADAGAIIASNATFGFANPLLALAYGVNVSMPKVWESSSASLPKSNYKIKLISPYGNAYSQLFNIYLPLSMVLAGALPRSTGSSSYVSPFFCEVYDRGRNNVQLGMIDNVSITRGTANLAFTRAGHPNSVDIELSVANLDEIVAVDVTSGGVISKLIDTLDVSDTPFTTYMNTIAAVDVYTLAYRWPKLRLKLAERYMTVKSVIDPDPAAFAAMTVETIPGLGFARNILGNPVATLQALNTY